MNIALVVASSRSEKDQKIAMCQCRSEKFKSCGVVDFAILLEQATPLRLRNHQSRVVVDRNKVVVACVMDVKSGRQNLGAPSCSEPPIRTPSSIPHATSPPLHQPTPPTCRNFAPKSSTSPASSTAKSSATTPSAKSSSSTNPNDKPCATSFAIPHYRNGHEHRRNCSWRRCTAIRDRHSRRTGV